jgi:hypothetical protein
MPSAIDPKSPKKRFDQHPRILRKKPAPVTLDDTAEALLRMSDGECHRELFKDFCRFCRDAGAWVVSSPLERVCRVQMPDGSPLLERLAQRPKYPVVKMPAVSHRLQSGRFIEVQEIQVTLWSRG